MEVLEIGPGSGFTAFRLSRQVRHLTAVEISAEPVQQLRASLKEIRNLKLVCADVCAPDLHRVVDRRFDAAFGLEVFEYLRDPRACLKNLAAVLRPGASLLLEFPNYPPPRSPGITYFRSRQEFDPLMYAAGFARWELYALRLRRHARVLFRAFHERPLQWFRALHERNGRPKPMTYDQTWAFQNRRRFEAHMPLLHAAWALLSAAMHCGGDCFERMELGSDLLNHDLLVLARR
jgi:SAM-dependent methyltransferase